MLEFAQVAICVGIAGLAAISEEPAAEIKPSTVSPCHVALGAPTVAHGAAGRHDVRLHWLVPDGHFVGKNAAALAEGIRRDIEAWSHDQNIAWARWSFRGWQASADGRTIVVGPAQDSRTELNPRRHDKDASLAFGFRVYSFNDAGEVSVAAMPDARRQLEEDGINIESVTPSIRGDLLIMRALGTVVKAYRIDRDTDQLHEIQLPDPPTRLLHHMRDDRYISLLTDQAQILTLDNEAHALRVVNTLRIPDELKPELTNDYRDIRNLSASDAFTCDDILVLGNGLVLGIKTDSLNIIASIDPALGELRGFTQARCCRDTIDPARAFAILAQRNQQGRVIAYSLAILTSGEDGTKWEGMKLRGYRDGGFPGSISPDGSICVVGAPVRFGGAFEDPTSLRRQLVYFMTRDGELHNESTGRADGYIWICD